MPHVAMPTTPMLRRAIAHSVLLIGVTSTLLLAVAGCARQSSMATTQPGSETRAASAETPYAEFQGAWSDSNPDSSVILGIDGDQLVIGHQLHNAADHVAGKRQHESFDGLFAVVQQVLFKLTDGPFRRRIRVRFSL